MDFMKVLINTHLYILCTVQVYVFNMETANRLVNRTEFVRFIQICTYSTDQRKVTCKHVPRKLRGCYVYFCVKK